jgi:hypothetical protein
MNANEPEAAPTETPNPYAAPNAPVRDAAEMRRVPDYLSVPIRHAAYAGYFMTFGTVVLLAIAVAAKQEGAWLGLIDVILCAGLAFGIQRKSRACAVALLVVLVLSRIVSIVETGTAGGLVMGVIIGFYLFKGVVATFAYHRFLREGDRFVRPNML